MTKTPAARQLARLCIVLAGLSLSGCSVLSAGSAVIGAGASVAKTAAKTAGAVVRAALPDGKSSKD